MRTTMLAIVLALGGCSTVSTFVEEHPKASAITAALIVGGLAAGSSASGKSREIGIPADPCANPEVCR